MNNLQPRQTLLRPGRFPDRSRHTGEERQKGGTKTKWGEKPQPTQLLCVNVDRCGLRRGQSLSPRALQWDVGGYKGTLGCRALAKQHQKLLLTLVLGSQIPQPKWLSTGTN